MKRGEIWTASGGSGYTGKPRPSVIMQDELFEKLDSVTICPMTSDATDLPRFRIVVEPDEANGLRETSRIMADKVSTLPKSRLGRRIGRLSDADQDKLDRAVLTFLGLLGGRTPAPD